MGDARWLGIGLSAVLLAAAGACVGHDDSCGGPTSDFPFCGDDDRGPDGVVGGDDGSGSEDGDNGGGAGAPAPESPPGSDAGQAGDAGVDDPGSCDPMEPIECDGAVTPLDVGGLSPSGPVNVTGVALDYVSVPASSQRTDLRFRAMAGRVPLVIKAYIKAVDANSVVAPVGLYSSADPSMNVGVFVGCDPGTELPSELTIFEHSPVSIESESSGVLRGELRISGGWDLTIPFEIHQACREAGAPPLDPDAGS